MERSGLSAVLNDLRREGIIQYTRGANLSCALPTKVENRNAERPQNDLRNHTEKLERIAVL